MKWIEKLSKELFWDTKVSAVDPDKNARWLIERVLERGRWEDWVLLTKNINRETFLREKSRLRLEPRERNFLETYLCR